MAAPGSLDGPFKGLTFVIDMEGPNGEHQAEANSHLAEMVCMHGGTFAGRHYAAASGVTHVVVRHMEQRTAQLAVKGGPSLVSDYWIEAAIKGQSADVQPVHLYCQPAPKRISPPGSSDLCISITGYTGMERRNLSVACEWIGFNCEKQMTRRTTHLLCFSKQGQKWEVARKWAEENRKAGGPGHPFIVNHRWLTDCMNAWEVLPPEKYEQHSGEQLFNTPSLLPEPWQTLHGRNLQDPGEEMEGVEDSQEQPEAEPAVVNESETQPPFTAADGLLELMDTRVASVANSKSDSSGQVKASSKSSGPPAQKQEKQKENSPPEDEQALMVPEKDSAQGTPPLEGDSVASGPSDPAAFEEAQAVTARLVEALDPQPQAGLTTPAAARLSSLPPFPSTVLAGRKLGLSSGKRSSRPSATPAPNHPLATPHAQVPASGRRTSVRAPSSTPKGAAASAQMLAASASGQKHSSGKRPARQSRFEYEAEDSAAAAEEPAGADASGAAEPTVTPAGPQVPRTASSEVAAVVGRSIRKKFGRKMFRGTVEGYDLDTCFFKVKYTDGDSEDLTLEEVEKCLLPDGRGPTDEVQSPAQHVAKAPAKKRAQESPTAAQGASRKQCVALSGFRSLDKAYYKDILHKLSVAQPRKPDSHDWEAAVTHLVMPTLKRNEKALAAMASGGWLLRGEYLDSSLVEGRLQDEAVFELSECDSESVISKGAPEHWRRRRASFGCGAFSGLRVVFYGKQEVPSTDVLARVIEAGDGQVLRRSQPYFKPLEEGVHIAVVQAGKLKSDKWVKAFMDAGVLCVSGEYVVDWVAHPQADLAPHRLYSAKPSKELAALEAGRRQANPSPGRKKSRSSHA